MAVASTEALRLAFEDGDPTRILGTLEAGWVDFKSQPYLLIPTVVRGSCARTSRVSRTQTVDALSLVSRPRKIKPTQVNARESCARCQRGCAAASGIAT